MSPIDITTVHPLAIEAATFMAEVCHAANRAICEAFDDHTQVAWDKAAAWQRESAVKGVLFAWLNPGAGPSAQHDAWSADKVAQGWVYGEVKDAEKKTHPCLVPYDQLPAFQRAKDGVFQAIANSLTAD